MPDNIETYYEPFCGGCSVLYTLLESKKEIKRYICSDINRDLINLWIEIKKNPEELYKYYKKLWLDLNKDTDLERKKEYFYEVRNRLNVEHNPYDFLFIMRTVTNGMPRYNKDGLFNNSFHVSRNGINPERLSSILLDWSEKLNKYNVEFLCQSYEKVSSEKNDVVYLDPPYANTKGMYFGGIDLVQFFKWLENQDGKYYLSFDGVSGDKNQTYPVPSNLYSSHIYLKSGNSSFRRILGKDTSCIVYESLYLS